MTRAALYARVSTSDKGQAVENQFTDFMRYCDEHGHAPLIFQENETATGKRRRPVFEEVLRCAEHKKFQILVVWALDRLTREGPLKAMLTLNRLQLAGVKVKSLTEPWLDPESPLYELMVPIFAWMAKQEAKRISERVHAGLARARSQGTRLGRPLQMVDAALIRQRRASGASWRAIARELKVSPVTCQRAVMLLNKPVQNESSN